MNRATTIAIVALCLVGGAIGILGSVTSRNPGERSVRPVTDGAELTSIGANALTLVGYDPSSLGYRVRFEPGRTDVRAQVDRSSETISVYLRRGDIAHVVAHDIAHELGHAYDQQRMNDAERRAYLASRGVPAAAWLPTADSDYAVGAGDFAEVFALCHSASPDFRSRLAPRPASPCELLPAGAR
jgi:hypothetical protein